MVRTEKNKYLRLFIRRSLKYFMILLFIIFLTIPLVLTSYQLVKRNTINSSYAKLDEGLRTLEFQMMKLKSISNILLSDTNFTQLLLLKGLPQSENYVDINTVQRKLRELCLEEEFLSNVYILFKDNPIFISNYISSDNYEAVYPQFVDIKGQTAEEWRQEPFQEKYIMKVLPQQQVYSKYYDNNYFEGIPCMINNSHFSTINLASSIIGIIDTRYLLNTMLDKDILESGFAYIANSEGDIIFRHHYKNEDRLQKVTNLDEIEFDARRYLIVTAESTKLGLQSVAGIPVDIFQKNIASMIRLVFLYSMIGICTILIASICFSVKETLSIRKLIDAAANISHISFNSKNNEYSYINNVIRKIGDMNAEQSNHIHTLNNSIKALVLENLFTLGVYTKREEKEILSYFNNSFHLFCVVKIRLFDNTTETLDSNIKSEIEKALKASVTHQYVLLNFHQEDIVLVIFFDETDNCDVEILRNRLQDKLYEVIHSVSKNHGPHPVMAMGVSMIVSGVKNARNAYLQASYAINSNQNSLSNEVYFYNTPKSTFNKRIFDIGELLKLYNVILSGDKKLILQICNGMFESVTKSYLSEQEQLQVFFTLRQTVYNAYIEITSGHMDEATGEGNSFPEYVPHKSMEEQFNELIEFTISLCDIVDANKRSNNEKLKERIIDYIEMNYHNMDLTADRIAEEMLISEKYVFAFIKEQTGKSLGKYIEDTRISKAEEYLARTEYTNKKIAQVCGFGSENTFYRAFAKKHGISPTVWRKNCRK